MPRNRRVREGRERDGVEGEGVGCEVEQEDRVGEIDGVDKGRIGGGIG